MAKKQRQPNGIFDKAFIIFLLLGTGTAAYAFSGKGAELDAPSEELTQAELNVFVLRLRTADILGADSTWYDSELASTNKDLKLKRNSIGKEVAILQKILVTMQKLSPVTQIDGVFGAKTEAALFAYNSTKETTINLV